MAVRHLRSQSGNQHSPGHSGIYIKPSHRGLLHKKLGVPQGEKIPRSDLTINPGDSTKLKEEKSFASNFGK
jgi:hypothetical protein